MSLARSVGVHTIVCVYMSVWASVQYVMYNNMPGICDSIKVRTFQLVLSILVPLSYCPVCMFVIFYCMKPGYGFGRLDIPLLNITIFFFFRIVMSIRNL